MKYWKFFDHLAHFAGFAIGFIFSSWKTKELTSTTPDSIKMYDNETVYLGPLKNCSITGSGLIFNSNWTYKGHLKKNSAEYETVQFRSETFGWVSTGIFSNRKNFFFGYIIHKHFREFLFFSLN